MDDPLKKILVYLESVKEKMLKKKELEIREKKKLSFFFSIS
jgi:hypothetical protein